MSQLTVLKQYTTKGTTWHFHIHTPRTRVCDIYRTLLGCYENLIWPRGYKTFIMLNSAEHGILTATVIKGKMLKDYDFP